MTFDPWDMGTDSYSKNYHPVWNSTFVYCIIGMKTKTKRVPVQIFEKTIKLKYVANFKVISQEQGPIEWVYNMRLLVK